MRIATESHAPRQTFQIPVWLAFCVFLAIAAFFLLEEHRAHIFGVLPYALLLLCPIIHLFMHRGHGTHGAAHSEREGHPAVRRE